MNDNKNTNHRSSLFDNAVLNFAKTAVTVVVPLLTFMYTTRVFGVNGYGLVSFSKSFVYNFSLISMLGITPYAVREASRRRNEKAALKTFYTEVVIINLVSLMIAMLLLVGIVQLASNLNKYKVYILIYSIELVFQVVGVEWLYTALEEYRYITLRTIAVQVASLLLVLIFIKDESDLTLFCLIQTGAVCVPNLMNMIIARRYFGFSRINLKDAIKHIKPIMYLFIMLLFINAFRQLDTIMLGLIKDENAVGLYSAGDKMSSMLTSVVGAISAVAFPRLAFYSSSKDLGYRARKTMIDIAKSILMLSIPLMIGTILFSSQIVLIFSGGDFVDAVVTTRILSLRIVLSAINSFFTATIFIVNGEEIKSLISTAVAALFDFVMNLYMIPLYSQNGAAVATIGAEIVELFLILFFSRKMCIYKELVVGSLKYLLISLFVIVPVCGVFRYCMNERVQLMFILVPLLIVAYFCLLYVLHDDLVRRVWKRVAVWRR